MQKVLPARFQEKLLSIGSVELCVAVGNYPGGELGKQQEAASPSKTKKLQCCRVITD